MLIPKNWFRLGLAFPGQRGARIAESGLEVYILSRDQPVRTDWLIIQERNCGNFGENDRGGTVDVAISSSSRVVDRASLAVQMVKNLHEIQETQVQVLGGEDSLEKEMATHSSILVWRIPWTEEPGGLQSMGSHRVGND